MKLKIYYILLLFAVGCTQQPKQNKETKAAQQTTHTKMDQAIFKNKVVIILAKELDDASNQINIQDFVQDGKPFIPVFTSLEKFDESTRGQLKNPKIEIDGVLLLSILHGNETLRVNPSLEDETFFPADALIAAYKEDIIKLTEALKASKAK